jgi:hypothetical protein
MYNHPVSTDDGASPISFKTAVFLFFSFAIRRGPSLS